MKATNKVLVVGRTSSGKDTIATMLSHDYDYEQLISTTTRPRRFPGEETHVFVSEEEANKMTERVAETVISGYQYFATREQYENCDVYLIDPNGLEVVCRNAPDQDVIVVNVRVDMEERKRRAMLRAADPEKESVVFDKRNESERQQFDDFENLVDQKDMEAFNKVYGSVKGVIVIDNNGVRLEDRRNVVDYVYTKATKKITEPFIAEFN